MIRRIWAVMFDSDPHKVEEHDSESDAHWVAALYPPEQARVVACAEFVTRTPWQPAMNLTAAVQAVRDEWRETDPRVDDMSALELARQIRAEFPRTHDLEAASRGGDIDVDAVIAYATVRDAPDDELASLTN